jgi:hypothetical protein
VRQWYITRQYDVVVRQCCLVNPQNLKPMCTAPHMLHTPTHLYALTLSCCFEGLRSCRYYEGTTNAALLHRGFAQ